MMENTEHAFFRALGFSVHGNFDGVAIGWPRVSATCEFFKPLRFEETVEIQLIVAEVRTRSVRYAFRFWKDEAGVRSEIARGGVATVCASLDRSNGKIAAVPIPPAILAVIQTAPAELLAELSLQKTARVRAEDAAAMRP
jgi:acyl-CoA thioesterase FadM